MPNIRIILDPDKAGKIAPDPGCEVIHLADDADVTVMGLPDGMSGGKPSIMMGFKLPSGDLVVFETSWRLFASVYSAFLGKFGEPELPGMRIETPETAFNLVKSDVPFVRCGECDWSLEGKNTRESLAHLLREYERHYRKKHPKLPVPPIPPFPELN